MRLCTYYTQSAHSFSAGIDNQYSVKHEWDKNVTELIITSLIERNEQVGCIDHIFYTGLQIQVDITIILATREHRSKK